MDFEICLVFYVLNPLKQFIDFIQRIEKVKYLVVRFVRNYISQRLKAEKVAVYIRQNKKFYFYRL